MDIELRLLRSFVAIHESGSISRAAERMACTQAAMSMRLKMLETEIGAPLFLRRPGGLVPTPRGAEFYAKALGVLSSYDEMMSVTRHRPPRNRLRIGMPDDYASGWLAALMRALGRDLHRLEVEVTCDLSANLMAALERRDIELALVTTAARPVQAIHSVDLPLVWLVHPDRTPGEAVLAAYPEGCVFRRAMTQTLDRAGVPWRVGVQSRSQAGIFAAVRSGRAVTAVLQGAEPPGLLPIASGANLPALPDVAVHLILAPDAARPARQAADILKSCLLAHA
ncbi:LysR family transcriptional regulator [Albidovulum sediminis]|uniref:LysR family transcriptional regulator n=1 Tax=Albidovulum sediminis TaxID=3066345 RepID=A0ABT2NNS1_9RHOB|nr:LysR family transcriptional regulator [Defluviimonas sediminis]MCT8330587.1 LysR family transcriptional regulator [Defluviimonas sediminis]